MDAPLPETSDEILKALTSQDHAWWFDYVEKKTLSDGTVKSFLRGTPHFSQNFWDLYLYKHESGEKPPKSIRTLVESSDFHRVTKAIRAVLNGDANAISHTIHVRTGNNSHKMVEVYLRRLTLNDGATVLASLHSDLTISTDAQLISRTVCDRLQGFVFVKKWDPERRQFVFTYVNQRLADVFELESAEDANGKSDVDFIANKNQLDAFERADQLVFSSTEPAYMLVREEAITPKGQHSESDSDPIRLLTFKMQYYPPARNIKAAKEKFILGIAFDISGVTDILRELAESSEIGIFIKDSEMRYQLVNKTFSQFVNAQSPNELLHLTFSEFLKKISGSVVKPNNAAIEELSNIVNEVYNNDAKVLDGGITADVRTATFYDGAQWITQKRKIAAGKGAQSHILGTVTPLFGGKLAAMLDKLPQCVSVKRYYPETADKQRMFQLVWGNKRYLERHGKMRLSEILGLSDCDLWPKAQAETFAKRDLEVIETGLQEASLVENREVSEPERWNRLLLMLKSRNLWEFRETQRRVDGTLSVLQTTKWPEVIYGVWYVIVVYSDVTKSDSEQQLYHDMTVHTIRGAISPIDIAKAHLEKCVSCDEVARLHIEKAKQCLADVSENVGWFLTHHLELLKMNVSAKPTQVRELALRVKAELEKTKRNSRHELETEFLTPENQDSIFSGIVLIDLQFIVATIAELIRNAHIAIGKVINMRTNIENGYMPLSVARETLGWNLEEAAYAPKIRVEIAKSSESFILSVSDNGAACCNTFEKHRLLSKFEEAKEDPYGRQDLRLGIPFCVLVMEKHGAAISLDSKENETKVSVAFPLL